MDFNSSTWDAAGNQAAEEFTNLVKNNSFVPLISYLVKTLLEDAHSANISLPTSLCVCLMMLLSRPRNASEEPLLIFPHILLPGHLQVEVEHNMNFGIWDIPTILVRLRTGSKP
jgi:hypothetical protein